MVCEKLMMMMNGLCTTEEAGLDWSVNGVLLNMQPVARLTFKLQQFLSFNSNKVCGPT